MASQWRSSATWNAPATVLKGNVEMKSALSPAVTSYASRIYCLWAAQGSSKLSFLILNDTGPAGELQEDDNAADVTVKLGGSDANTETSAFAPAMVALEGIIHAVYPDEYNQLVHIQYDDKTKVWNRRCGLGIASSQTPALAILDGELVCACIADGETIITLLRWTDDIGWSHRERTAWAQGLPAMTGRLALFELNARLGVVGSVTFQGGTSGLSYYPYDEASRSWVKPDPPEAQGVGVSTIWGVGACCVNDLCFATYATNAKVAIKQMDGRWLKDVDVQTDEQTVVTPAVCIMDNRIYSFWVDTTGRLRYMTRRALGMPQLNEWMKAVSGNALLSSLSLPGIHDAAAFKKVSEWSRPRSYAPMALCQSAPIGRLLEAGIRYIDLRAGYLDDKSKTEASKPEDSMKRLIAYHNFIPMANTAGDPLTIESIFKDCYTFLDTNPSEALVIQIKQDYEGLEGAASRPKFATDMRALMNVQAQRWILAADVPKLGDLRGKIQLVRRFPIPGFTGACGIDVSDKVTKGDTWQDNKTFSITAGNVNLQIQDVWSIDFGKLKTLPETKFEFVKPHLTKAIGDKTLATWYINFTSANKPGGGTGPASIANGWYVPYPVIGVNSKLKAFINAAKANLGRYGTIIMDFPQDTPELINGIVRLNIGAFGTQ